MSKLLSFKIVLLYVITSALYIYTSDYLLEKFVTNIEILSKLQTYKGLGFIIVTAGLLFMLVKKNIDIVSAKYQELIQIKQLSREQLIKSQEDYMSLFNHSPLPMWIFDTDTLQFLLVNEAAVSTYGYTQEEYMKMTLRDIRPPEDIPTMERMISESINTVRHIVPSILRHKKKNGEIIEVKLQTVSVPFGGKKVRLASVVDLTEEINIQNQLKAANSRLQLASEIAKLGYWSHDLIRSKMNWSDEVYRIFEVDPKTFELTLENIKDRFCPVDHELFNSDFFTSIDGDTINESERKIITGKGKTKWLFERQYMIKDNNGTPVKLEGITLDITNRKLYEHSVWESNERFKMLAKATADAIIDWDIHNKKVLWGEGFHTILGYDLSEYNIHLWADNIHTEDREKVLSDLEHTLKDPSKEYFNAEFRFFKANREVVFVQLRGIFIRDNNGQAIRAVAAMTDLTESLARIRKIEIQNKALRDIAWTQSHIVRAPLANLMGLVEILKNNFDGDVSREDILEYINISAIKLDAIIHEIIKRVSTVEKD